MGTWVLEWRSLEESVVLGLDMAPNSLIRPKPKASEDVHKLVPRRMRDIFFSWVLEGRKDCVRINLI